MLRGELSGFPLAPTFPAVFHCLASDVRTAILLELGRGCRHFGELQELVHCDEARLHRQLAVLEATDLIHVDRSSVPWHCSLSSRTTVTQLPSVDVLSIKIGPRERIELNLRRRVDM